MGKRAPTQTMEAESETPRPKLGTPKDIGRRLYCSRLAIHKDWTQEQFADEADVSRTCYVDWENGKRRISLRGALALCNTYNLSLDWFYYGRIGCIDDPHLKKAIADIQLSLNRQG